MLRASGTPLLRVVCTKRAFSSSVRREKPRLVILGSGWGGYEVLRGVDKKRWDVVLVSPNNYFNFTPLLAGCAVGTLEFRCAIEPVRRYSPAATMYQAWCDKIGTLPKQNIRMRTPIPSSPHNQHSYGLYLPQMPATKSFAVESSGDTAYDHQISTTNSETGKTFPLKYDTLVISVGAYSQTFGIPGVKEHAHFLKDVRDARAIRSRILECFEIANQPTLSDTERRQLLNFCVVGGGPTGVEFAAELHDLVHDEIWKYYPSLAKLVRINLYDVAPKILGTFDQNLVQYTEKTFRREGINVLTSHHVDRVEAGKLHIKEQGEVHFGLLVWATGLLQNPLIESIAELKKHPKTKSVIVNEHLNALKTDGSSDADIFVIGDAASVESAPLPATAQVANQQAKYLYKKLNKIIKDQPAEKPFEFHNQGSLAYIGNW
ncbi:hypothetical protein D9757_001029 [Collybiopsis confluens]|uniref:FAD/NAD(P)-binding domain-containing protein n=1 Tax=Collybiopsis confluens TaxID=2823264 RepID=A0A8H5I0D3_9AGAR|nr:hypothetical protein D9757_001029 [Collybiopsis confluens]